MRTLLPILLLTVSAQFASAEKFSLDPAHTAIEFKVPHLVISNVKGRFDNFQGTFDFDEKTQKLENLSITIQADSINTNQKDRDKHLRSADFLNVAKHPQITFKGTKVIYEKNNIEKIEGNLNINGITKQTVLAVKYNGAITDQMGARRVTFDAETKINRKDFGLVWNKAIETGGVVVGDEVKISIDGEAVLVEAKKK